MQKFTFSLLFSVFFFCTINAQQHYSCDGSRYTSEVFPLLDTFVDVLYGNNTTFNGANQDLKMDIFVPEGDTVQNRPVVMLAFGGSFIGGQKEDVYSQCIYYAKRGYVAITIDYRLYDGALFPLPSPAVLTDEVVKAVSDMKAAIRYMREDAATSNLYKIDTNFIFVGGISAGGILASHLAYLDSTDTYDASVTTAIANNGGWKGNSSSNYQYSSEVQGVLNFSGALKEADYIDANDPPLFSAHDDADGTVPYAAGSATIFTIPVIALEGSSLMHTRASSFGIYNRLITIPGSTGHVSYFSGGSTFTDSVYTTSCVFMNEIICPTQTAVFNQKKEELHAVLYPNPTNDVLNINIDNLPSSYHIAVFDNMGRLVFSQDEINESAYSIKVNDFSAGIYFVNIRFEDSELAPLISKVIFSE